MITLPSLLPQIFNGIQFGVLIALLATGLSLIFGMLGIINFAHGAFYMLGAYLLWSVMQCLPIPGNFWLGLMISFLLMGVIGLLIERFLLRRLYGHPEVYQILITFGLILLIQQGVALIYSPMPLPLGIPPLLNGQVNLGLFHYLLYRFFTMILGLAVIFVVWFF